MIKHTNAYLVLRQHSQQMLDFAVLICTSVPQLRHAFREHSNDPSVFLAANTAFRPSVVPYSTEKRSINSYKRTLGANLLLSVFSYFETYFFTAIDELIEFHGGEDALIAMATSQVMNKPIASGNDEKNLKYLRTPFKNRKTDRYMKYSKALRGKDVIWPTQRLVLYGVRQLLENRKRWKSVKIPVLTRDLLTLDVDDGTESKFHNLRGERNKIAHGKTLSYDLKKAIDACMFFRQFARTVDEHICKNFLVMEKYIH